MVTVSASTRRAGRVKARPGPVGTAAAVAGALVADRAWGEPPAPVHPVAVFGRVMERAEPRLWSDRRAAGVAYASGGVILAVLCGTVLDRGLGAGPAVALATYAAVAERALGEAAEAVAAALSEGDLAEARVRLRSLVGRRTDDLDEAEICRAVVESVAENTVDAVVAPILWAAVGGARAALAYRAINTLDAMVGHHNPRYERFGWASARADDLANWVPARLAALAVAAIRPGRAKEIWRAVKEQAPAHPSPNAGVVEAAFAAALAIRLGGVNDYAGRAERRPPLGAGRAPEAGDITAACRLGRRVDRAVIAGIAVSALVRTRRGAR